MKQGSHIFGYLACNKTLEEDGIGHSHYKFVMGHYHSLCLNLASLCNRVNTMHHFPGLGSAHVKPANLVVLIVAPQLHLEGHDVHDEDDDGTRSKMFPLVSSVAAAAAAYFASSSSSSSSSSFSLLSLSFSSLSLSQSLSISLNLSLSLSLSFLSLSSLSLFLSLSSFSYASSSFSFSFSFFSVLYFSCARVSS
jgi:hypothetical protein